MTRADIEAIEELSRKATPGPFEVFLHADNVWTVSTLAIPQRPVAGYLRRDDAICIAALLNNWPSLRELALRGLEQDAEAASKMPLKPCPAHRNSIPCEYECIAGTCVLSDPPPVAAPASAVGAVPAAPIALPEEPITYTAYLGDGSHPQVVKRIDYDDLRTAALALQGEVERLEKSFVDVTKEVAAMTERYESDLALANTKLADSAKFLETVRQAMGTSSVWEGLNVIDGLRDELKGANDALAEANAALRAVLPLIPPSFEWTEHTEAIARAREGK